MVKAISCANSFKIDTSGIVQNKLLLPSIPNSVNYTEIVNLCIDNVWKSPIKGMDKAWLKSNENKSHYNLSQGCTADNR